MENLKITEEGRCKLNKLPFLLKYVANYLIESLDDVLNGNCSEDQVACMADTLKCNSEGRISREDTMNYDQAGKILGFGTTNRVGLKRLLDKNGIKQIVINNQKVGFLRSDIMALHSKMYKCKDKTKKVR